MTHGSLFSGIGGFDLASQWMGWENKFHCEWNEFGQKVLKYYWPEAELFTDITKSNFTKYANKIDILTGGFPCQPYSSAGKRLGKEDSRHLWPEMLRAIREIQPRWVVGENVRGLTNWNGGVVFDEVQSDLEAEGYEVLPFLLPAAAVNAPHRRDRIWFVAHSNMYGSKQCNSEYEVNTSEGREYAQRDTQSSNENGNATDTNFRGLEGTTEVRWNSINAKWNGKFRDTSDTKPKGLSRLHKTREENNIIGENTKLWRDSSRYNKENEKFITNTTSTRPQARTKSSSKQHWQNDKERGIFGWQTFPTVSPICDGDDGLSNRLDNITFPKWRNESIKAGGNAIVPQVVYQIFKAIEQYELILLNEGITNTISNHPLA